MGTPRLQVGFVAILIACASASFCAGPAEARSSANADEKAKAAEIKKAAEHGDVQAEVALGMMYAAGGMGVRHSYKDAVRWWEDAEAKGNARAAYFMGVLYDSGKGVPHDDA